MTSVSNAKPFGRDLESAARLSTDSVMTPQTSFSHEAADVGPMLPFEPPTVDRTGSNCAASADQPLAH